MTNKSPTDCRRSLHALLDVTLDADWNPTLSLDFHYWFHISPSGRVWSVKCSNGPVNAVGRRWVHGHTSLWHFMLMRFLTRSSHDQQVAHRLQKKSTRSSRRDARCRLEPHAFFGFSLLVPYLTFRPSVER